MKTFPPNHLGLYDLEGNVMEWVDDSYGGPESLPIRNYGVARGGSYLSFRPKQLTTSIRTPCRKTRGMTRWASASSCLPTAPPFPRHPDAGAHRPRSSRFPLLLRSTQQAVP